jgi:glucosyl-3-phosphoglycerate synthase
MMADVFRVAPMERICQVDIAESYDHKHQSLSEANPDAGLNKMACDVALCLLRTHAAGVCSRFDGLIEKYLLAAQGMLRFYAADARMNTLDYDVALRGPHDRTVCWQHPAGDSNAK